MHSLFSPISSILSKIRICFISGVMGQTLVYIPQLILLFLFLEGICTIEASSQSNHSATNRYMISRDGGSIAEDFNSFPDICVENVSSSSACDVNCSTSTHFEPSPSPSSSSSSLLSLSPTCEVKEAEAKPCRSGQQKQHYKWCLDSNHRCNVQRYTHEELLQTFGLFGLPSLHPVPIVITYNSTHQQEQGDNNLYNNKKFQQMTSYNGILKYFSSNKTNNNENGNGTSHFNVTLSSSNSFANRRRTISLRQYLEETISSEALPHHKSNESWYFFGETYSNKWIKFLQHYHLPPCQTCSTTSRELSALSFGIGNRGSGVQWHIHGPGFSQCLHGRKHWVLYPPTTPPLYNVNYTSRFWMEHVYTNLSKEEDLPYECTLYPGDMIYFPDRWYHATINLDRYTAFISTFTTEHDI